MDEVRLTRFITPSAFFLASLFFGAWLENPSWVETNKTPLTVAMIAGATAAALFPVGFTITAIHTIVLRFAFYLNGKTYQLSLSEAAWKNVWSALNVPDAEKTRANMVSAALSFDCEMLHERVHNAAVRLWSAFNIAAASCTALILALFVGYFALHIKWTGAWLSLSGCLFLLFACVARVTWRDHMNLLEFQSHRIRDGQMPSQKKSN